MIVAADRGPDFAGAQSGLLAVRAQSKTTAAIRHRRLLTQVAGVDVRPGSCVASTVMSTTVRNCTRDEGGPFEVGNQVLISSHRKLLLSKAMVVSVAETPGQDSGRQG